MLATLKKPGRTRAVQREAPRIHHATRRRGGSMAARGACAAAGDAGGGISPCRIANLLRKTGVAASVCGMSRPLFLSE
jgi:hypothetical protein